MIKVAIPIVNEKEIESVAEVLRSGNYTSGVRVENFEKKFAEYIGTKYAIACNSGTAALHMVYQYLGFDQYSTFITAPMSFFATISAGLMCNSFPTFVDVDDRGHLDPEKIEEVIHPDTKAIVPVHLYGHPCQIEKIISIGKRYGIPVIEDCAQAHGAEVKKKKVGSFGFAGCFSFFATKNMTTIEGGMITTDSSDLYEYCKAVRSHGMTDRHTHTYLGYNYRMNEVSAAIGQIQLEKLDDLNFVRNKNSLFLQQNIVHPAIQVYTSEPEVRDVYFWQPVFSLHTKKFLEVLKKNEIGYRHRYWEPLYKQPIFKNRYKNLILKNAEMFSGNIFGLPNHPGLRLYDLQKIVKVINGVEI